MVKKDTHQANEDKVPDAQIQIHLTHMENTIAPMRGRKQSAYVQIQIHLTK